MHVLKACERPQAINDVAKAESCQDVRHVGGLGFTWMQLQACCHHRGVMHMLRHPAVLAPDISQSAVQQL